MTGTAAMYEARDPEGDEHGGSTGLVLQNTYALGARIGEGGMGEVYEARHVRQHGRVAVKILSPHLLANENAFARFCREAEIMSTLNHPHIIQIFDFNTAVDGRPYFVMEYLDGVDLAKRLYDSGAQPLAAVVRIVDAVASALGAAHDVGIVHRDLKPANIFLMRGEEQESDFVKVIDFGISVTPEVGPRLSVGSQVIGTPEFMAPEQALGMPIDARTDQFALAAITYTMLTGHEPFRAGDATSLLYQVVHEKPLPLSRFLSADSTGLQAVLDRGLAKHKKDRFDSIGAFASALRAVAQGMLRDPARPSVIPARAPAASPSTTRAPTLRHVLRMPSPSPSPSPPPPPPTPPAAQQDRSAPVDRIPRGPQRKVALGLGVLGLAAMVAYSGWYRGFPERVATLEHHLVNLVHTEGRTAPREDLASVPAATHFVTPSH
jgi:serine/threonine-protein kinase